MTNSTGLRSVLNKYDLNFQFEKAAVGVRPWTTRIGNSVLNYGEADVFPVDVDYNCVSTPSSLATISSSC